MNYVQPIRDKSKLEEMKYELKKNGTRDFMMFYTGINTGLRISDLVKLNKSDVRNSDGSMKTHHAITEKKTGKQIQIKEVKILNIYLIEQNRWQCSLIEKTFFS